MTDNQINQRTNTLSLKLIKSNGLLRQELTGMGRAGQKSTG